MRPNVDGDQTIGKVSKPAMEVWSPWQTAHARRCLLRCWPGSPPRLAQLTPPRPPGRAVPAAGLGGPPGRRRGRHLDGCRTGTPGRMIAISKAQVGDSLDLLLGALAALGYCQPDGTFVGRPPGLRERLVEMAATGEAVVVDGWPREERPRGWTSQQVLYDAKRHARTAQAWRCRPCTATCCGRTAAGRAAAMSRRCWRCQGWMGAGRRRRGRHPRPGSSGAWPRVASTGMRRSGDRRPRTGSAMGSGRSTACRQAAGAGGAGDRPSRQRVGAAPLARVAVPDPGGVPGCWRTGLSWPLAAGRLVQIEDGNGQILSNRVVVDNPAGLAAALTAGSTPHAPTGRPS
jgi:hypothetical protein